LRLFAWLVCAAGCALQAAMPASAAGEPAVSRMEARSDTLMAVGIVQGDRLTIHVTRVVDNAPVRDAVLTVLLRGGEHPTVAESDGSYTLQAQDLTLPGAASMEFQVVRGPAREVLKVRCEK